MRAGIRQVVILAAGLDSRAYRLDWPAGTTVFEIDQPKVLEYKTSTLDAHGALPKARRVPVAVDLRDDWPAALIAAGFDACAAHRLAGRRPAAVSPRPTPRTGSSNLSPRTARRAAGSRSRRSIMHPSQYSGRTRRVARRERTAQLRERLGLDIDVDTLIYADDERADAAEWLADHGWRVDAVPSADEMTRLGRPATEDLAEEAMDSVLLHARLEGGAR